MRFVVDIDSRLQEQDATMNGMHDNLIGVLRKRREYCRVMLELAGHQRSLIHANQSTELLQVIAKKQRVLAGLTSLAEEFGGLTAHWKSVRDSLSDEERAVSDQILAESESLLAQTLELESRGTEMLVQRREKTRGQLRELGELAQTLPTSETTGHTPEPQFLDVSR